MKYFDVIVQRFECLILYHHSTQAESLFSGENINVSVVLALVDDLAEITVPDTDVTRSLFPSDLNTTNLILTGAVDLLIADLNQTGSADPRQVVAVLALNGKMTKTTCREKGGDDSIKQLYNFS